MPRSYPLPATIALLLSAVVLGPARAQEMRSFDKNGDGKPDKWAVFKGQWPVEIRYDTNADGRPDQWEFLEDGRIREVREDRDFDGRADRIVVYKGGRPSFKKVDADFDGRFDELSFFDGTEDVRTASPELTRLLAEKAGEPVPPAPKKPPPRPLAKAPPPALAHPARVVIEPKGPPAPDPALSYFDVGIPQLKVPMLGGLEPGKEWRLVRDRENFLLSAAGRDFELRHEPSGGALWVDRSAREEDETGDPGWIEHRMEGFARTLKPAGLAAQRAERAFRTPLGPALKRTFQVVTPQGGRQVVLYVLAGPRDVVYVGSACGEQDCGGFEKLTDAMVYGVTIVPTPAALP